jgi:endonuclease/exonuclease/phosphatase family metal-dependent hydrolase
LQRTENHDITRLSTQDPNPVPAPAPGFLEAEVDVRGRRIHVYVTHLDYRADPAVRLAQVEDTVKILAQDRKKDLQLLLGDFNAEHDAPELAKLWRKLDDGWLTAAVTTGGPSTYPAVAPVKRIDYVAVGRGFRVARAAVPAAGSSVASDHRPIVTDLYFKP